jgi:hypothetical protein
MSQTQCYDISWMQGLVTGLAIRGEGQDSMEQSEHSGIIGSQGKNRKIWYDRNLWVQSQLVAMITYFGREIG